MDSTSIYNEDIDSWETLMFLYNSALKEVGTKLEILNDEFVHVHKYRKKMEKNNEYGTVSIET